MFHIEKQLVDATIEGSLGGKVTPGEMNVFSDELKRTIETCESPVTTVVLNWSKALPFEPEVQSLLDEVRDWVITNGHLVVNVVRNESEVAWYSEYRWQSIADGNELYQLDESLEELAYRENVQRRAA